jgi:hypothetical protein
MDGKQFMGMFSRIVELYPVVVRLVGVVNPAKILEKVNQ